MRLAIMAVLLFSLACDRSAAQFERESRAAPVMPEAVMPEAGVPDVVVPEQALAEGVKAAAAPEGVGQRCLEDRHCSGYLRCMNERCAIPPAVTGEATETTPVAVFRGQKDRASPEIARFYLELALTAEEQSRGLMFRRHMEPDWGMIFIYPGDRPLSFWMKNTLISLDMIFIHSSGEVMGVVEGAEPLTLTPRTVNRPARYVLELKAGTAAEHGIGAGTWMSMEHVDERYQTGD